MRDQRTGRPRLTQEYLQGATDALRSVGIDATYQSNPDVAAMESAGWDYFEPGQQPGEPQRFRAGHNPAGAVFIRVRPRTIPRRRRG
jgi:hypothetical protein